MSKSIKQIAEDCGIDGSRAGAFLEDIVSGKYRALDARGAIEETMGEIIVALYRRIEELEKRAEETRSMLRDMDDGHQV